MNEIVQEYIGIIINIVVTGLGVIIGKYLLTYLQTISNKLNDENKLLVLSNIEQSIVCVVEALNQLMVYKLKDNNNGKIPVDKVEEIKNTFYTMFYSQLTENELVVLQSIQDYETWVNARMEAAVYQEKKTIKL